MAVAHEIDCRDQTAIEIPVGAGGTTLHNVGPPGWLVLRETGVDLSIELRDRVWSVDVPPRLGTALAEFQPGASVSVHAVESGTAGLQAAMECAGNGSAPLREWFEQASKVLAGEAASAGSREGATGPGLDELIDAAPTPELRALGLHLEAQSRYTAGQAAYAARAFLSAALDWDAVGMTHHAFAARVGATEDYIRAGNFVEALAVVDSVTPSSTYYGVRLEASRCLALRYGGNLDSATQCYARVLAGLSTLDARAEFAAQSVDLGTIELELGRAADALQRFTLAADTAEGDGALEVRGRAAFFSADAFTRLGRFPDAVDALGDAMALFEVAGAGRWRASALLRLGALLLDLGAPADAAAAVDEAMRSFDSTHAPARVAAAGLLRSRIALELGDGAAARRWAASAVDTYQRLAMPRERATAELHLLQALFAIDALPEANLLARSLMGDSTHADAARRVLAEIAIRQGRLRDAREALDDIADPAPMSERQTRLVLAQARLRAAEGNTTDALSALRAHAQALAGAAHLAQSPALTDGMLRWVRMVDAVAIEILLDRYPPGSSSNAATGSIPPIGEAPPQTTTAADLLEWLPHAPARAVQGATERAWGEVDRALATELFPTLHLGPADPAVRSRLLAALTIDVGPAAKSGNTGTADPRRLRAEHLQGALAQDEMLLVLLEGEKSAAALVLDRTQARLLAVVQRTVLSELTDELAKQLQDATSPVPEIVRSATLLDAMLFGTGQSRVTVPDRLTILATGTARRIPWPALALVQPSAPRTISMLVATANPLARNHRRAATRLDVFSAAQAGSTAFATLAGALATADLLRKELPQLDVRAPQPASRPEVLAALGRPGARMHVAAHGSLAPGRLGGSGVWLDPPDAGSAPEYLSWLDLRERLLAAELVVLDACQLAGPGADAGIAQADFASTMVRSGVHHVVAALWPVSDTASAAWIPGFHARAAEPGADIASALAEARARLARSRAFRHPFYWAGLVYMRPFSSG